MKLLQTGGTAGLFDIFLEREGLTKMMPEGLTKMRRLRQHFFKTIQYISKQDFIEMSKRFFTSDWHLYMSDILRFEKRGKEYGGPFAAIEQMNNAILQSACQRTKNDDILIHVGDLYSFKTDRGFSGGMLKPAEIVKQIPAVFINIRGNHDINNKVFSLCDSMRTMLGKRFHDVSISHYPTYDRRAVNQFENGDIHLCGHVHSKWKHCLDLTNNCLNVNVGIDKWNYKIVSEEEIINYLNKLLKKRPNELFRCQTMPNGKIVFYGMPD